MFLEFHFFYEQSQSITRILGLHKCLTNQETAETNIAEFTDRLGIRDAALTHLAGIFGQKFCQAVRVLNFCNESSQITIVDTTHIRFQSRIVEF